MKTCKHCNAELDPQAVTCPSCGKAVEAKADTGKLAMAIGAVVVLAAMLLALILVGMNKPVPETTPETALTTEPAETVPPTIPPDGEPGTITEKGSYTASDETMLASRDTVVARIGDKTLTNGQLQIYYWNDFYNFVNNYYYYLSYVGLNLDQSLDTQLEEEGLTWQQYFLQMALDGWHQYQAMAIEAEKAGTALEQEAIDKLAQLKPDLEEAAAQYGKTAEEYILLNFGHGTGFEEYYEYMQIYYQGLAYYNAQMEAMKPTQEEALAYFTAHEEEYAANGVTKDTEYVDVRHILIMPEESEDGTVTEEAWAAADAEAQRVRDLWLAGEKTEDSFAALANEYSDDGGSNTAGGLYEDVAQGKMVKAFDEWCFDPARAEGDYDIVETEYGYHVMYFVRRNDRVWQDYAEADIVSEKINELMEASVVNNTLEVYYDKIAIAVIPEE